MKKLTLTILIALALLPAFFGLRAQDAPEVERLAPLKKSLNDVQTDVRVQLDRANQQLGAVHDRMVALALDRRASDIPAQSLIIRPSDTDAKNQAHLEEDLAVMLRILDKATQSPDGPQTAHFERAMGINVLFAPGPHSIRSLYLEGYGALFMVNVNFPLLPPPSKSEPQPSEPAKNSTWEDARREIYGVGRGGKIIAKTRGPRLQPYGEEKVNTLQQTLLESLKNAANMRDLKPEDSITVCVFGGPEAPANVKRIFKRAPEPPSEIEDEDVVLEGSNLAPSPQGTLMTIRAKKADVDAFAKDKLAANEFRKKATVAISTYNGDTGKGMMGGLGGF